MPSEMFGDVILTSDVPSEGCVLAMSARCWSGTSCRMDVRNGSDSRKLGSPRLATLDVVSSGDFQALRLRPSASPFGLDSHPAHH